MKTLNCSLKYIASAILLTTVTAGAFAASPNGPKPKCQLGLIPVVQNGSWVCAEPGYQSGTQPQAASTGRGSMSKVTVAKPERAKPDLSIANLMKLNDPTPNVDTFKVYVKNTGPVKTVPCKMSLNSKSGGGEVSVPSIPANGGEWIEVKFFEYKDGSRIQLAVDSEKKIAESNEANNKYSFNW